MTRVSVSVHIIYFKKSIPYKWMFIALIWASLLSPAELTVFVCTFLYDFFIVWKEKLLKCQPYLVLSAFGVIAKQSICTVPIYGKVIEAVLINHIFFEYSRLLSWEFYSAIYHEIGHTIFGVYALKQEGCLRQQ